MLSEPFRVYDPACLKEQIARLGPKDAPLILGQLEDLLPGEEVLADLKHERRALRRVNEAA